MVTDAEGLAVGVAGNKLSKHSAIYGTHNIVLQGKVIIESGATIRGDLADVRIGRYTVVTKDATLRPPFKKFHRRVDFIPQSVGDYVFIGQGSVVNAAYVGSYVYIGQNVVLGKRCFIQDSCLIENNSIVPPETVISSYSRVSGSYAVTVDELPECFPNLISNFNKNYYKRFGM